MTLLGLPLALKHKFALVGILSLVLYGMAVFAWGARAIADSVAAFRWEYIPIMLALLTASITLRYFRWRFLLRTVRVDLRESDSVLIFLAGMAMVVTPGKIGELSKCYLINRAADVPIWRTVPVIMVERLTDFIAVIIVGAVGALVLDFGVFLFVAMAGAAASFILVVRHGELPVNILKRLERVRATRAIARVGIEFFNSGQSLLATRVLLVSVALSLAAWSLEAVLLGLVFDGFDLGLGTLEAALIFSTATLAGALTMLPGGLGAVEWSMGGLIVLFGAPAYAAASATLVYRFMTLWVAFGVGLVTLGVAWRWRAYLLGGMVDVPTISVIIGETASGTSTRR